MRYEMMYGINTNSDAQFPRLGLSSLAPLDLLLGRCFMFSLFSHPLAPSSHFTLMSLTSHSHQLSPRIFFGRLLRVHPTSNSPHQTTMYQTCSRLAFPSCDRCAWCGCRVYAFGCNVGVGRWRRWGCDCIAVDDFFFGLEFLVTAYFG